MFTSMITLHVHVDLHALTGRVRVGVLLIWQQHHHLTRLASELLASGQCHASQHEGSFAPALVRLEPLLVEKPSRIAV